MRILVVGRGTGEESLPNGHSVSFASHATSESAIVDIQAFDFVLQHIGPANPEAQDAIKHWQDLGHGHKLLGLTGGERPISYYHLKIPWIENAATQLAVLKLNWAAVPTDFAGSGTDLLGFLLTHSLENLIALAILCQGYLVLNAEYDATAHRWGPPEILPALTQMGVRDSNFVRPLLDIKKAGMSRQEIVREYWLKPFGLWKEAEKEESADDPKWAEFERIVKKEWGSSTGAENDSLTAMLTDLKGGKELPSLAVVADAYCEIARRLGSSPCVRV